MAATVNCFKSALQRRDASFGYREGFADADAAETLATAGLDVQFLAETSCADARK